MSELFMNKVEHNIVHNFDTIENPSKKYRKWLEINYIIMIIEFCYAIYDISINIFFKNYNVTIGYTSYIKEIYPEFKHNIYGPIVEFSFLVNGVMFLKIVLFNDSLRYSHLVKIFRYYLRSLFISRVYAKEIHYRKMIIKVDFITKIFSFFVLFRSLLKHAAVGEKDDIEDERWRRRSFRREKEEVLPLHFLSFFLTVFLSFSLYFSFFSFSHHFARLPKRFLYNKKQHKR